MTYRVRVWTALAAGLALFWVGVAMVVTGGLR